MTLTLDFPSFIASQSFYVVKVWHVLYLLPPASWLWLFNLPSINQVHSLYNILNRVARLCGTRRPTRFGGISKTPHSITRWLVRTVIHPANETSPWAHLQVSHESQWFCNSAQVLGAQNSHLNDILTENVNFSLYQRGTSVFLKASPCLHSQSSLSALACPLWRLFHKWLININL